MQGQQQTQLKLQFGGQSLVGKRRENQDAFIVNQPDNRAEISHKGIVATIADGVSCSSNSQLASQTATMQFVDDYYATPDSWSVKRAVTKILTSTNQWLFQQSEKQQLSHNSLVTTFSGIIFKSNTAHLFHVGDSRIYLLRDNTLKQLTRDHQRTNIGQQSYLTRALGMDISLEVDYQGVELKVGDKFILTTDGVHDFLDSSTLVEQASQERPFEQSCQAICQAALDNGSEDNLTCLLIEINEIPELSLLEHQQHILTQTIPPALTIGQQIDRFKVVKVLYAGTRSHVYQVQESDTDQLLVMKIPSLNYAEDYDYLVNFANESWVGQQLDNPRVMKMLPTPRDSRFVYQLCEYIEGITLRQWMYDHPQPTLASVRVLLDGIVRALRVLQRADMVHRDLKPENIMITGDNQVKIIDFGSVMVRGLDEMSPADAGEIPLGAINYIAPEYINTGEASLRSDLFSIAVIGYEMLTGELPYKPMTGQQVQSARHLKWDYRSIRSHREQLPEWVDLVFQKATHPLPASRYQALSEFMLDLHTPNTELMGEFRQRPLLERNPVLFWKVSTFLVTSIALIELLVILGR